MYHTNKINQASSTKFSQKHFPSDHYTSTKHRIVNIIKLHPNKKLSNAYLAEVAGCTPRTVTRITTKLYSDGFISKQQEHKYSLNNYNLIQSEYVQLKKDLLFNLSLSSKKHLQEHVVSCTDSKTRTHGRAEEMNVNVNVLKKGNVMNATQKQMILANRNDPKIKEILNTPNIKAQIITPEIEKIAALLHLDEKEQFRLVAYPDDALEHAFMMIEPIVMGKKVLRKPVKNKMGWLLKIADVYCEDNGYAPDWKWYRDLCKITGMDSTFSDPKPLIVNKHQPQKHNIDPLSLEEELEKLRKKLAYKENHAATYGGIHGISQLDKKTIDSLKQQIEDKEPKKGKASGYEAIMNLPLDERILKLRSELAIHQERFTCYTGPEYMQGLLGRMIERVKIDLNDAEVRSNSEKQVVQHTNNTDTLAEDGEECESFLRPNNQGQGFLWPVFKSTARG